MKHSKKWISSALVLSLSVGLSACGNANDKKKTGTNVQWSKGAPCPQAVTDEYLAIEAPSGAEFDKLAIEQQLAAYDKAISLTEAFYKKYLGRPSCKVEKTLPSGEKEQEDLEFPTKQEEVDALIKVLKAGRDLLPLGKKLSEINPSEKETPTSTGSTSGAGSTPSSQSSSSQSSVPACEEAYIKDAEDYATETISKSLLITPDNSSKTVEELATMYEAMMKKYIGHADCSVDADEGKKQTITFPKTPDELKKLVAETKNALERAAQQQLTKK